MKYLKSVTTFQNIVNKKILTFGFKVGKLSKILFSKYQCLH